VPLRPLSLMHGQGIAVVELVGAAAPVEADRFRTLLEHRLQDTDLRRRAIRPLVLRLHQHVDRLARACADRADAPEPAVQKPLLRAVPQAHELVAGGGQEVRKALQRADAAVEILPRAVPPNEYLVGRENLLRIDVVAMDDATLAVF